MSFPIEKLSLSAVPQTCITKDYFLIITYKSGVEKSNAKTEDDTKGSIQNALHEVLHRGQMWVTGAGRIPAAQRRKESPLMST